MDFTVEYPVSVPGHDPALVTAEGMRQVVRAAEEAGYAAVGFTEHPAPSKKWLDAGGHETLDPIAALSFCAAATERIRLMTYLLVLPYHNPFLLAKGLATVDLLSGGRLVVVAGTGYLRSEFLAAGVDMDERNARFDEAVEVMRGVWTHVPYDHEGRFFTGRGVAALPAPATPGGPPIWIGGQSAAAIRRAARLGDAWYAPPFPSHDELADLRKIFLEERAAHGLPLDGDFPLRRELIVASSRREAEELARQRSALRYQTYRSWGLSGENTPVQADAPGIDVEKQFLLGSPAEIVEQLARLRDELGMTHFMFKSHWQGLPHADAMRQLELFGTKVLPELAG